MIIALLFILGSFISFSFGIRGCDDLTGVWIDEDRSEIHLRRDENDRFIGLYAQKDEGIRLWSSKSQNLIHGIRGPKGLIGFTVIWDKKKAITTFIGQCLPCGNIDYMNFTWIRHDNVNDCHDAGDSYRINVVTFYRDERKSLQDIGEYTIYPPSTKPAKNGCHLAGTWRDERGARLRLGMRDRFTVIGNISSSLSNRRENKTVFVNGKWDSRNPTSDFGLFSFPDQTNFGEAVLGWSGQCFLCDKNLTLNTIWVMATPVRRCGQSWNSFFVGKSKFFNAGQNTPGKKGSSVSKKAKSYFG